MTITLDVPTNPADQPCVFPSGDGDGAQRTSARHEHPEGDGAPNGSHNDSLNGAAAAADRSAYLTEAELPPETTPSASEGGPQ